MDDCCTWVSHKTLGAWDRVNPQQQQTLYGIQSASTGSKSFLLKTSASWGDAKKGSLEYGANCKNSTSDDLLDF